LPPNLLFKASTKLSQDGFLDFFFQKLNQWLAFPSILMNAKRNFSFGEIFWISKNFSALAIQPIGSLPSKVGNSTLFIHCFWTSSSLSESDSSFLIIFTTPFLLLTEFSPFSELFSDPSSDFLLFLIIFLISWRFSWISKIIFPFSRIHLSNAATLPSMITGPWIRQVGPIVRFLRARNPSHSCRTHSHQHRKKTETNFYYSLKECVQGKTTIPPSQDLLGLLFTLTTNKRISPFTTLPPFLFILFLKQTFIP